MATRQGHEAGRVGDAAEVRSKLALVRTWLEGQEASGVVFSSQANFAWMTGGGRSHIAIGDAEGVAHIVVTSQEAVVMTSNIESKRLQEEELPSDAFSVLEWPWYEEDAAEKMLSEICDPSQALSDLGAFGLASANESLVQLRYTLTEPELGRFRDLGRDCGHCVEETCRSVEPGSTEHEVAGQLAARCVERDILPLVILVASDDRISAHRHPLPTGNRFRRTLLVSLSGRRYGLHVSVTRMVSAGPAEPDLIRRHRATAAVDARLILQSAPGARLGSVFQEGLAHYDSEGFGQEWRLHHQGGLTGYSGREIFAGPETGHVLEAGQAVAWNPSITGAKSEDTAVVTERSPDVVSRTANWPEITIELDDGALPRPALLDLASGEAAS